MKIPSLKAAWNYARKNNCAKSVSYHTNTIAILHPSMDMLRAQRRTHHELRNVQASKRTMMGTMDCSTDTRSFSRLRPGAHREDTPSTSSTNCMILSH